jgi:acetolactate synthase I/II/III large subunit
VLLILGSRLSLRQVSYNWKSFARFAHKIQVDVDALEFNKPTSQPEMAVHSDVKPFLAELLHQITESDYRAEKHAHWLGWCRERVQRYPVVLSHRGEAVNERINPYYFIERLFAQLEPDDVVVCGDGTANVVTFQAARLQKG